MRKIILCFALAMNVLAVNAQETEKKSPFSGSVELTTKSLAWSGILK